MKVNGCYGAVLNDCVGKISNEHIVSNSILSKSGKIKHFEMQELNKVMEGEKSIGTKCYTVKNLCKGHNSQLSILDDEIKYLMEVIDGVNKTVREIDGPKLERWFLKTFINYSHSWSKIEANDIDYDSLAKIVFGKDQFHYPYGLYFSGYRDMPPELPRDMVTRIIRYNNSITAGCAFSIRNIRFVIYIPNELGVEVPDDQELRECWFGENGYWHWPIFTINNKDVQFKWDR